MTLDRTRQGLSAAPVSSTTAAAVSSHELSTPRISTLDRDRLAAADAGRLEQPRQAGGEIGGRDALLGDDPRDVARGRDVERRVADLRAVGRDLRRADVRD